MAAETRAGLNNMSKAVMLREVVVNKLTTAAQEIFATVERTVTGYEEEASGLRNELDRLRRQLELLAQPEIKVESTDNLLPGGGGGGGGGEKLSRFDLDVEEFGIRDVISYAEEEEEGKDEEMESAESTRLDPEELRDPGPQVPVERKGAPLKFRVGLLQNSKADSLMDNGLKSPVVKCPRGLQEPDFLDLLRSTFPQLTGPFNAFTSDSTGRSSLFIRVKAAKKTPKEKKKLRSAPRKDGEERRSSKVPEGSEPAERLSNGTSTSCLRPLHRHTADRTPRKSRAKREGGALPAADNREEEEEEEEEEEGGSKPDENEEKSRESKAKKRRRKSRESSDKKKKRRKKLRRKRQAETERGGDLPVADNGDEKEEEEEKEEDLKPDENHKEPRKSRRSQGVQTKSSSLGPGDPGQQTLRIKEGVMAPPHSGESADRGSPPGGGLSVKRRRSSGGAPLHRQADPLPADGSKKPRCPRDPKDPDLLDLLRSTFPQGPPYLRVHQCTRVAGGTVQLASGKLLPVAPPRPLER